MSIKQQKCIKKAQSECTALMLSGWRVWKQTQGESSGQTILKNDKGERMAVEWKTLPVACVEISRNRKVVDVTFV